MPSEAPSPRGAKEGRLFTRDGGEGAPLNTTPAHYASARRPQPL